MGELTFAPLVTFAEITMGQSPEAEACNTDQRGMPFLQGCAEFGSTVPDTSVSCTTPLRVGKFGSVLISVRAPVGTMNYANQDYCIGRGLAAFKAKPGLANSTFLKHAVEFNINYLHRRSQGSTFAAVSSDDIRSLSIPDFGLQKQNHLATILTSIDTAIEKTEALIAKYQQIKAGLMHDLFTRGVLSDGSLRPPREKAPELYQETAMGWIPRDWQLSGLAARARSGTSWIRTGPFGSSLKSEHWQKFGHPVITIGALGVGDFVEEELLFIGNKDARRLHDFQLKAGDVVFSRVADVGRSVVIRSEQIGWIMSSNLMRIALSESLARPDYLQMQLADDPRLKSQIRARVNSGGRDVANTDVLSKLQFVWPEIPEQDRTISLSDKATQRINFEIRKVKKLQHQKLGLMQDLLTGKVPVRVEAQEAESQA